KPPRRSDIEPRRVLDDARDRLRREQRLINGVDDSKDFAVGEVAEDPRADEMRAGEHERLAGAAAEAGDQTFVQIHGRELVIGRRAPQRERSDRLVAVTRVEEIEVAHELNRVAVDEKELLSRLQEIAHAPDPAACTENPPPHREPETAAGGRAQKPADGSGEKGGVDA